MKPVIQICGYKNSGKTTLIAGLLPLLRAMHLRVAVIKHDVHGFEADVEGTDTYKLRTAGAAATAITSPMRTAVIEECETPLTALVERFQSYDLIIVEGFKREAYPKLVLMRSEEDLELVSELEGIQGIVLRRDLFGGTMDLSAEELLSRLTQNTRWPVFYGDDVEHIAQLIGSLCKLNSENQAES
ncbi:molybdopterin-guanine dinucleotide biosynthesis protein B [Paenibacillus sp. DYY-L-2]|uniref:molybdopterin-guanine dinucleotide biosynthesis protein B n=1 Tax=Paenibacillus sp. DYY-L-2 TaxID=3447013 RepID=UPI003F4FC6F8